MKAAQNIFLASALGFVGCVEPAAPKMALSDAEIFCAPRAEDYARSPIFVRQDGVIQIGLLAETPDDFMVQDFYRRCVYSQSGQRASGDLEWRL